ncbi:MAG TPA: hypothetical protein PKE45_08100 [Caldilineaceae bacterium]|nr:hypothetical protein [Caldilineaceae bacterium]
MLVHLKPIAQKVSIVLVGLMALYGVVSFFTAADHAFAAPWASGQAAPALQPSVEGVTVPPFLNFQGSLRDPAGNPLNGEHRLVFRIYGAVDAPLEAALWNEEHTGVTVRDGYFNVLLGDKTPLPPAFFAGPDLFIGVTVDTFEEMTPRQRFASAPYAMYADHASSLTAPDGKPGSAVYVDVAGRVGVGTEAPAARLHISGTTAISPTMQVNAGNQELVVDASGIALDGNVQLNGSSNGVVSLAEGGGNVGVGVSDPQAKVHVAQSDPQKPGLMVSSAVGNNNLSIYADRIQATSSLAIVSGSNGAGLYVDNGRVGIGTAAPTAPLQVVGGANVDNLVVTDKLTAGGKPPVLVKRFTSMGNDADMYTGISYLDYNCVAASWTARYDLYENGPGSNAVWTYVSGLDWFVRAEFNSHNTHENPAVDVVCFSKVISSMEGAITFRGN